jgi:hypothetical protein
VEEPSRAPAPVLQSRWCAVCAIPHGIPRPPRGKKVQDYIFHSIPFADALEKCAEEAPGAVPWQSSDGRGYAMGKSVLVLAPGQSPASDGAQLIACSAGYQARSTLRLKNLERKRTASATTTTTTPVTANTASCNPGLLATRGYRYMEAQRDALEAQRDALEAARGDTERRHKAEQEALLQQLHDKTSELDEIRDAISRELGKFGVEMKGSYVEALRRDRAVQVDSIKTRVERAPGVCNQRLKL